MVMTATLWFFWAVLRRPLAIGATEDEDQVVYRPLGTTGGFKPSRVAAIEKQGSTSTQQRARIELIQPMSNQLMGGDVIR
jgi:hypothetical protein